MAVRSTTSLGVTTLRLDDGKIHLHLVEPTRVHRRMDEDTALINVAHALLRRFPPMRRAVLHTPEQASSGAIRWLAQHLMDQTPTGLDACGGFTLSDDVSPAHIPHGQVLERSATLLCMFDAEGVPGGRRKACMTTASRLHARCLVGAEAIIRGTERLAMLDARIEVGDRPGFVRKLGIPRKEPRAIWPGFDRVLGQDTPDGASTHRLLQGATAPSRDVPHGLATEGLRCV
jgi:hypothetical protein